MSLDDSSLIRIMWAMLGTFGVTFLGLLAWGIKKMITTLFENTLAIRGLTIQVTTLNQSHAELNKLSKDMNVAHGRIRELQRQGEKQ